MLLKQRVFTLLQRVYFIACQLHVASRPHLFCSLLGVAAEASDGARRGVRCGGGRPSPATQTRGVCSESMVEFVCVMENVDVVAQQSTASVPTCSDSKTRSQRSFLTFSVSGHVPLMLLLRTLPSVLASVRRSTYFRTFFAVCA